MTFSKSPSLKEYQDGIPPEKKDRKVLKWFVRGLILIALISTLFFLTIGFYHSSEGERFLGYGSIRGFVYNENGEPLQGEVFLQGSDKEYTIAEDGSFSIQSAPAGRQSLIIANNGTGKEYAFTLSAGEIIDMGDLRYIRVTPEPDN